MSRPGPRPYSVFVSYARDDAYRKNQFLAALKDEGIKEAVAFFDDRHLTAGRPFAKQIDTYMGVADVILLLVTDDFLASRYCMEVELPAARGLAAEGRCRLLLVRLSRTSADDSALADIASWPDSSLPLDEAADGKAAIAEFRLELKRMIVEDLKVKTGPPHDEHSLYWWHQLYGVPLRSPRRTSAYVAGTAAFCVAVASAALALGLLPARLAGPFTGLWLLASIGAAAAASAALARNVEIYFEERREPGGDRVSTDKVLFLVLAGGVILLGLLGGAAQGAVLGFVVGLLMGLVGLSFAVGWGAVFSLGILYGALHGWNHAASTMGKHLRIFQELGELEAPPAPPERD